MSDPTNPKDHRRFRASFQCDGCGHEFSVVYEWPGQDRFPAEDCPECGAPAPNVVYQGAERIS